MKKVLFLTAVAVAMTACSNDVDLGLKDANKQNADNAIGFQVLNKNMSRATSLEDAKHYNFGVFAYKNTQAKNIMDNYLVGYFGPGYGYKKLTGTTDEGLNYTDPSTTVSDWGYEGLGYGQYDHDTYVSGENFYLKRQTDYMSNIENQYLRYWDLSANHVNFYAYAPYIQGANTVSYDNSNHTLTFPVGSIQAGVDDVSKFEYMYAAKKVTTTDFKKAVQLGFKRLNAKVNIAFYEDIQGYSVTIDNLKDGTYDFISANPASAGTPNAYSAGLYKTQGATIKFNDTDHEVGTVTLNSTSATTYAEGEYIKFMIPTSHNFIATSSADALNSKKDESYSPTTYYAIPKSNDTGLTFRVSFTLTSDTGETIKVKNAAVHVSKDYTNWEANKHYTYIFKITKDASGSTESDPTITPSDPTVPGKALYPIVFDNCTVEVWTPANDTETGNDHNIN